MVGERETRYAWRARAALLALALVVHLCGAAPARAQTGRIGKSQAALGTAFWTDAQTWDLSQTYKLQLKFQSTSMPTVNGAIGYDGLKLYYFQGGLARAFSDGDLSLGGTVNGQLVIRDHQGLAVQDEDGSPPGTLVRNLSATTTDATPAEMSLDGVTSLYLTLASDSSHGYVITVVGRGTAGVNSGKTCMYTLRTGAANNSGSTALEGDPIKEIVCRGVIGWDADVTASDAGDRLVVTVTGDGSSTVKWSATVVETIVTN